jgi:hypothetical protein
VNRDLARRIFRPLTRKNCYRKRRFHEHKQAKHAARLTGLRAYFCDVCNGYHLTSRPLQFG